MNIVYLDYSKAFPMDFDSILIVKMMRYGQEKGIISWMENCLNCQAKWL